MTTTQTPFDTFVVESLVLAELAGVTAVLQLTKTWPKHTVNAARGLSIQD